MTQPLEYAPPPPPPPRSRVLAFFANVTLAYPLLLISALYGEWLLAWHALGHVPRASLDDPKDVEGSSWMHLPAGLLLMGFVPAAVAAMFCNAFYLARHRHTLRRSVARGLILAT